MFSPHEPDLLSAGSDDLLAIAECGLQREPIGDRREDLGNTRRHVGAEEATHPLGSSTSTMGITPRQFEISISRF